MPMARNTPLSSAVSEAIQSVPQAYIKKRQMSRLESDLEQIMGAVQPEQRRKADDKIDEAAGRSPQETPQDVTADLMSVLGNLQTEEGMALVSELMQKHLTDRISMEEDLFQRPRLLKTEEGDTKPFLSKQKYQRAVEQGARPPQAPGESDLVTYYEKTKDGGWQERKQRVPQKQQNQFFKQIEKRGDARLEKPDTSTGDLEEIEFYQKQNGEWMKRRRLVKPSRRNEVFRAIERDPTTRYEAPETEGGETPSMKYFTSRSGMVERAKPGTEQYRELKQRAKSDPNWREGKSQYTGEDLRKAVGQYFGKITDYGIELDKGKTAGFDVALKEAERLMWEENLPFNQAVSRARQRGQKAQRYIDNLPGPSTSFWSGDIKEETVKNAKSMIRNLRKMNLSTDEIKRQLETKGWNSQQAVRLLDMASEE